MRWDKEVEHTKGHINSTAICVVIMDADPEETLASEIRETICLGFSFFIYWEYRLPFFLFGCCEDDEISALTAVSDVYLKGFVFMNFCGQNFLSPPSLQDLEKMEKNTLHRRLNLRVKKRNILLSVIETFVNHMIGKRPKNVVACKCWKM